MLLNNFQLLIEELKEHLHGFENLDILICLMRQRLCEQAFEKELFLLINPLTFDIF